MNYSDKIVEFLDGDLSALEEKELFSMLAADESLRSEMKSIVKLNSKISNSRDYYQPAPELTASIYNTLNIATEPAPLISGNSAKVSGKFNLFSGLLGGAFASVIFISYLFFAPANSSKSDVSMDNIPQKQDSQFKNNVNPSLNEEENSIKKSDINNEVIKITTKKSVDNGFGNKKNILNESLVQNSKNRFELPTRIFTLTPIMDYSGLNIMPSTNSYNLTRELLPIEAFAVKPDVNNILSKLGLTVSLNSMASWNLPKETIYPTDLAKFNNMGINILYDSSEIFTIGAELRQETFFVKYSGTDTLKQFFKYEQHPNFTSYGLLLRCYALEFSDLRLFSQGNFSANNYGIVARLAGGAEYYLYPDLSLSFIMEYSGLFFNHQNKWFDTRKIGINYGLNFKF